MPRCNLADSSRPDRWMYCIVVSVWRWPAKVAMACSSHPLRARSVRHRWRNVWVPNRGTLAAKAMRRTSFDHVHNVIGDPRFLRDSDKNNAPRAADSGRRWSR